MSSRLTEFDELRAGVPPAVVLESEEAEPSTPVRRRRTSFADVVSRGTFLLAALVVAVVVLWSLFPGLFTSDNPIQGIPREKLEGPSASHWLGTDYLGRDLYARIVYGSRQSVSSVLLAIGIALVVGTLIGLGAGFLGRLTDSLLSRITDTLLAIPSLLLAMVVVASLGFETKNVAIAVGVSSIALFARLTRSEVIRVRSLAFVESSEVVGGGRRAILFEHVLPHVLPVALSMAVLQFGYATLSISSLAFLGFGSPPPAPDWGHLVSEGQDYMNGDPWLVVAPSLVVVVTVLAFQRLSQGYGHRGAR